ncbi:MAG: LamG domain-containing protein, partial [Planctomycetota bacterium]
MCKKLIYLVVFVLVLGVAGNASADLVAHWKLDEGSGNTVYDSGTSGNDGTFESDPQWVAGYYGGALEFDGTDDNIDCGNDDSFNITDEITLSAWINITQRPDVESWYTIPWKENAYSMYLYGADSTLTTLCADFWLDTGRADIWDGPDIDIPPNHWTHIAVTFNGTDFEFYVNGERDHTQNQPGTIEISEINFLFTQAGSNFEGLIDDVRLYNRALTQAEILAAMEGGEAYPYALGPVPENGSLYMDTWVNLSWRAGDYAVSHDVYVGENFEDVDAGAESTFQGNQTETFYGIGFGSTYPDGLVPGTTYYWRIDEVNDAEPNSPWKGDIWSFSIPPKTAYFPDPADGAETVSPDVQLSWTAGFGAKIHYIVFGEDFDEVNNAETGVLHGNTTYNPGPLKLAKTYYWRVDESDGAETIKGEVWSFTTLGAASGANPANGAVNVKPSVILRWDAGSVAASHEVYFGMDADAVKNATTASPEHKGPRALGEESYDPGELLLNSTYFWRIDEVNGVNPDSPWAGKVWSFTIGDFFVIDDFEDYDVGNNEIWWAWKDGLGYAAHDNEPAYLGNGTGSAVGDETTASYTEEIIVHSGLQSMPFSYDNNKVGYAMYSEVELMLNTTRDWTEEDFVTLTIWFRGESNNDAEPLYVTIANNTGAPVIVVHDDPVAAQIDEWTEWIIPLQTLTDQ